MKSTLPKVDWSQVRDEVIQRLDMRTLVGLCHVEVKRVGSNWMCCCPFHAEKSESFICGGREGLAHRGHCFGCSWDGDIFAFWQEIKSVDFKQSVLDLAALAGVPVRENVTWTRPEVPRVRGPERAPASERPVHEMPSLPPLRLLRLNECEEVARNRGLSAEAVWLAARRFKRMAFSEWPLYPRRNGKWLPGCEKHGKDGCYLDQGNCVARETWPSWCAIDETRNTAEFRRLDNLKYPTFEGEGIKSWSTKGKSWPLGAAAMNGRAAVMLVEGGPDMLAAYHFLMRFGMLERVAVVCMLGASNRMREESLSHFRGKRVRIMMDADPLKDCLNPSARKVPALEAAARWGKQLSEAGAVVQTFCVGPVYDRRALREWMSTWGPMWSETVPVLAPGLALPDGTPVKDLNDLAKCEESVWRAPEVRRAFLHWDF